MSDKKPWSDEPTPLCDKTIQDYECGGVGRQGVDRVARDLERRLRLCQRHLKWVSRCAAMRGPLDMLAFFIDEDRMTAIRDLVKRMEQDGKIPLE